MIRTSFATWALAAAAVASSSTRTARLASSFSPPMPSSKRQRRAMSPTRSAAATSEGTRAQSPRGTTVRLRLSPLRSGGEGPSSLEEVETNQFDRIAPSLSTSSSSSTSPPPPSSEPHFLDPCDDSNVAELLSEIERSTTLSPPTAERGMTPQPSRTAVEVLDAEAASTAADRFGDSGVAERQLSELERFFLASAVATSLTDASTVPPVPKTTTFPSSSATNSAVVTKSVAEVLTPSSPQSDEKPKWMPAALSDVWNARILLLLSAALYGTNFTVVKALDESIPDVGLTSVLRFGFASLVMLPWLIAPMDGQLKEQWIEEGGETTAKEPTRLGVGLAGFEVGMYNSVGYIAQAVGLRTISASKSAFICSMAVVTVPILDRLIGKRLVTRQILGTALAAFGVYSLEMGGSAEALTFDDLASLLQPLMFGLGFWRMEHAMKRYPTEAGRLASAQVLAVFVASVIYLISPWGTDMAATGAAALSGGAEPLAVSSAFSTPYVFSEIADQVLSDPALLGMLVWTGVVTTAFTVWMETMALKTLSAAETTLIFSTEPLFGAAFAVYVGGETLGPGAAVGAAFILGGCLVSGMDFDFNLNDIARTSEGWFAGIRPAVGAIGAADDKCNSNGRDGDDADDDRGGEGAFE